VVASERWRSDGIPPNPAGWIVTTARRRAYELLMSASLPETDPDCPFADQLAAYILGSMTGTEQLVVATHVRQCPMCQYAVATIRRPESRRRTLIAALLPLPLAEGQRRSARYGDTRQY